MKCPRCDSKLVWQSDFGYEDLGYDGEGVVSYYSCQFCNVQVEICYPEEEEEECLN